MKFHFGAAAGGRIGHCVGRRSINRVNKQRSYEKRAIFKSALFLFGAFSLNKPLVLPVVGKNTIVNKNLAVIIEMVWRPHH